MEGAGLQCSNCGSTYVRIKYGPVDPSNFIQNEMDAFHSGGLRDVLKIEHSYYSRTSNQEVYDNI